MPVYKSTKDSWIIAHNAYHASVIEETTSQEQLIKADGEESLSGSRASFYQSIRLPGARDGSRALAGLRNGGCHTNPVTAISTESVAVGGGGKDGVGCGVGGGGGGGGYQRAAGRGDSITDKFYFQIQEPPYGRDKPGDCAMRRRAFKNLVVLGLAFMCLYTAFVSLQGLQSSLNARGAVGLVSLSCVYGATVFSCFYAPAVIARLTTKWTIVAGYCAFLIYFLCNFFPQNYVLIPSSLALGFSSGPLWSAQSTYLTTLAIRYAHVSEQVHDSTINIFNGIFCGILQTSQIWGNLLSAGVLSSDNDTVIAHTVNRTHVRSMCGANDCGPRDLFPENALVHHVGHVTQFARNMLLGAHVTCAVIAILLTAFLLDRNDANTTDAEKGSISLSTQQLFMATVRILRDQRLQALSPMVLFTGLEQGFVLGDFTKSYVNCPLGIHKIGVVMVCFGTVNAIASIATGHVARHVKRYPIMVAGTLFNAGLLMVLLWWRPTTDDVPMFYVISGCLGLCDAIWQTQTNTLFGILFANQQEAAFACYRMFQAVGFAVAFGYSYFLCVHVKVYVMAGVLVVALVFYSAVEFKLQQHKKLRKDIVVL